MFRYLFVLVVIAGGALCAEGAGACPAPDGPPPVHAQPDAEPTETADLPEALAGRWRPEAAALYASLKQVLDAATEQRPGMTGMYVQMSAISVAVIEHFVEFDLRDGGGRMLLPGYEEVKFSLAEDGDARWSAVHTQNVGGRTTAFGLSEGRPFAELSFLGDEPLRFSLEPVFDPEAKLVGVYRSEDGEKARLGPAELRAEGVEVLGSEREGRPARVRLEPDGAALRRVDGPLDLLEGRWRFDPEMWKRSEMGKMLASVLGEAGKDASLDELAHQMLSDPKLVVTIEPLGGGRFRVSAGDDGYIAAATPLSGSLVVFTDDDWDGALGAVRFVSGSEMYATFDMGGPPLPMTRVEDAPVEQSDRPRQPE